MIYPKKLNSKKVDLFLGVFSLTMIIISVILLIINKLVTPGIWWSHICIISFIYIYITARYSMTKAINVSGHVTFQTILIAALVSFIDYRLGYLGWSINIALPIIIIIANITMFILTLINYKEYSRYAINQLIIVLISFSMFYLIYKGYAEMSVLSIVALSISVFNFVVSLILCHKSFKEELIKKLSL